MVDGKNLFEEAINNYFKTYENIRKTATGQLDDYTTGCLLDYPYFKETYKMIEIDLSKQQALDIHPRAIQQINFTANLNRSGNTTMIFIQKKHKKLSQTFHKELSTLQKTISLNHFIFINIKSLRIIV